MNEDTFAGLTLSNLPKHFRLIALWFVVTLTVGYTTGLVFVMHTTSLSPSGVEERYRGNQNESDSIAVNNAAAADTALTAADTAGFNLKDADTAASDTGSASSPADLSKVPVEPEMKFEKSLPEMLNITHTHILAMTSFLAISAAIFALSSRASSRLKTFLIVEPFVAILTSFAAMWLMRYVHPSFSYLLMLSSGSFALCFYAMMGIAFVELVGAGKEEEF